MSYSPVIDVVSVFSLVQDAQPHLKQTPDSNYMQRLDAVSEHFPNVFNALNSHQRAIFALGLWRWCYERASFDLGIYFLNRSGVSCKEEFILPYQMEGCLALAVLSQMRGDNGIASKFFKSALRISDAIGVQTDRARILHYAANLYTAQGNIDHAQKLYSESLKLWEDACNAWWQAATNSALGALAWKQSNLEVAHKYYGISATLLEQIGDKVQAAKVLNNMSIIAKNCGHYDLALEAAQKCLLIFQEQANPRTIGIALQSIGDIQIYRNNLDDADRNLKKSLNMLTRIGYSPGIPCILISLGITRFLQQKPTVAAKFFGLSHILAAQQGIVFSSGDKNEIEDYIKKIEASVGKRRYAKCWDIGQKMDVKAISKM